METEVDVKSDEKLLKTNLNDLSSMSVTSLHEGQIGATHRWKNELNRIAANIFVLVYQAGLLNELLPRNYLAFGRIGWECGVIVGDGENKSTTKHSIHVGHLNHNKIEFKYHSEASLETYKQFSHDIQSGLIEEINKFVTEHVYFVTDDQKKISNIL